METSGLEGLDNLWFGNGNDKLAALARECAHLLHDLVLEIPREDDHMRRAALVLPRLRVFDNDVRARRELALLVAAAVKNR